MKDSQKNGNSVRQKRNPRTSKHDVNLQKNNVVYFQIGLILALLVAIFAVEYRTPQKVIEPYVSKEIAQVELFNWDEEFQIEKKKSPEIKKVTPSIEIPPKVVPNDLVIEEPDNVLEEPKVSNPVVDPSAITFEKIEDVVDVDYRKVEFVPIYPGCEGLASNEERKSCMQEKINSLISRNFNTALGARYGLEGVNRIDVQFTVNEFGKVTDVKTRAPHPALEVEAKRVINKIPEMIPGKQREKDVRVIYGQPIIFKTEN
tara:strand:- start:339 stop:1115 length:777 start_codon:yes stop_codon:yes gene_type:complete